MKYLVKNWEKAADHGTNACCYDAR